MVSKSKAQAEPDRGKAKVENKKGRKSTRVGDAELFRAVVEHSHDAILFLDSERKIFYASPAIAQISGYEPEELIGISGIEFNHPDDREALAQKFLELLQNPGKTISIENRLKHKNGDWLWVDVTATNFLEHPHVQAVVVNMRDITERRHNENELAQRADSMSALAEISRQIHTSLNLDMVYENTHQAIQRLMPCEAFIIALVDEAKQIIEDVYLWDKEQRWPGAQQPLGKGLTNYIISSSKALRVNDWDESHDRLTESSPFGDPQNDTKSVLAMPLFHSNGKCFGMISAQTYTPHAYTAEHEQLMSTLSHQVSKAIENAKLFDELQQELTERQKADQALRDSEMLYRGAIEVAGAVPYLQSYASSGTSVEFDFIGDGIRQITGYAPEEFNDKLWDSITQERVLLEDLAGYSWGEAVQKVRSGANPIWKCEHRIRHRNGEIRWVFEAAVELRDENGVSHGSVGMYQDITARKRAETDLLESEKRYRNLFDTMAEGVAINEAVFDENGNVVDYIIVAVNPAFEKQSVYKNQEILGKRATDVYKMTPEFISNWWKEHSRKEQAAQTEYYHAPDSRWFFITTTPPEEGRFATIFLDITERKRTEEVLREAENKYRNLVERLSHVIYTSELGNDGIWSYISPQIEKMVGFTPQEWLADPSLWYRQAHPEDRDQQLTLENEAHARKEPFESEYRMLTRAGNWIWVRDSGHILPSQSGGMPIVQGMLMDITERKQADEALRKSKQRLQVFFNQSLDGFFFCDFEEPVQWKNAPNKETALEYIISTKRFTDVNDAMLKQYGISREKFLSLTTKDVFAHDLEQGRELRRQLFDNGHLHLETYERTDAGTPVWFEGDYVCIYTAEGSLTGFFGIQRDITDRKHAEIALRAAEEKYRSIFENAVEGIYQSSPGGYFLTVNPAFARMLGFESPQEVITLITDIASQLYGESSYRTDFMLLLNEHGSISEFEYQMRRKDNQMIWVSENARAVRDNEGHVLYYEGIVEDITKRKQAEAALSLSKAQLLANLENTPNVAVQWYDKDGHILYWNPASESMYGWKSIEALGKTLEQLIHTPEEQAEFIRILAEVQETGKPYGSYEARVRRKDGTNSWVLATTFSMPMPDGQLGFVCMDVDITERKQAEEQIQRQLRRLNALHTIDMAINSSANVQITLEVLLSQTLSQLNIDAADVLLFNQPAQTLELTASRGFRSNINLQAQQRLGDGFAGQVINARRTLHISNLMDSGRNLKQMQLLANDSFTEYFGVPLIAKGQIKGVLEIYHRSPFNPENDWLNFLEVLAGQAAIAIDNAQLLQGLQRSNIEIVIAYDATIEGWSRAMDLRDKETEGHTQRVTTMTLKLARAMGIREADILHIQRGGLLHDIGKLGVPDNILLKQAPLTAAEWEVMRQHPAYAFNMIAPVHYLKPALDIPYCHHEKWDGTGYPRGLQGEQIPLAARIFAVVDVWDALTSDRPYRKAWTKERTVEYIREQSGKHFDPQVEAAFLKLLAEDQDL